jgi:hypothetical protein
MNDCKNGDPNIQSVYKNMIDKIIFLIIGVIVLQINFNVIIAYNRLIMQYPLLQYIVTILIPISMIIIYHLITFNINKFYKQILFIFALDICICIITYFYLAKTQDISLYEIYDFIYYYLIYVLLTLLVGHLAKRSKCNIESLEKAILPIKKYANSALDAFENELVKLFGLH